MNRYEVEEISRLPDKYRPIGAWAYFGYTFLFSIPIIGFVALVICALSGSNINRRSFARSYFCGAILVLILGFIVVTLVGGSMAGLLDILQNWVQSRQ